MVLSNGIEWCSYYFVHPIDFNEGKSQKHLSVLVSTKTEHDNLHEGRICCRDDTLDCIS